MNSISHLRAALINTLSPRGPSHGEPELFDELNESRDALYNLFEVGPRNGQEKRELESGKIVVNGRQLAVNQDFCRQVLFLSEQLDASERYCAELLHAVETESPNLNAVAAVERAILLHHRRRRDLGECLRLIFEACEVADIQGSPRIYSAIRAFAREYVLPPRPDAKHDDLGLTHRIFNTLEALGTELAKAHNARQTATSNTVIVPEPAQEVLDVRCEYLKSERRTLATVVFLIARLGYYGPFDVQRAVEWLSNNPQHAITYYILAATLVSLDSVDPLTIGGQVRGILALDEDRQLLPYMKKKLDPATQWKEPGLKATVLMKWTLFLTEARQRNPELEDKDSFRTEQLETNIWNALQGDAFTYLLAITLRLQRTLRSSLPSSFAKQLRLPIDADGLAELPDPDFKLAILESFDALVRGLISSALSELRKIKQRQEDLLLTSSRTGRAPSGSRVHQSVRFAPSGEQRPPRNDIATLFAFIGVLYTALPPDTALQYWGAHPPQTTRTPYIVLTEMRSPKLPSFLQWAVWSTQARDPDMSTALYDMLSGLSKGPQCAELAYNFMARGAGEIMPGFDLSASTSSSSYSSVPMVSWSTIFGILESWANAASNHRAPPSNPPAATQSSNQPWQQQQPAPPPPQQHHHQPLMLSAKDIYLADAFLRLLATTVTYSPPVRVAVCSNVQFRAIPTLLSLVPLPVPLELKGAIFETVAAFCLPGAGIQGVEICRNVWLVMERQEIIDVRGGARLNLAAVRGVQVELEEVESVHKLYPATIPFLKLLSTLIHTPKRVPLKVRMTDGAPIQTIPENLGSTYRFPGIGPFVSFVMDTVFSKIPDREYAKLTDRLQINDLCLCFMERCIASYELEGLLGMQESDARMTPEALASFVIHPGFDIMKRLLTASPVQSTVLTFITECLDELDRGNKDHEPFLSSMIVRVLRIILRVLEIQDIYLDMLIPVLSEMDAMPFAGVVPPRSYFQKLDQALAFSPQFVPPLAACVVHSSYPELAFLSVKILHSLASSSAFTNLAALIEKSSDSDRILDGYRRLMEADTAEDVELAEAAADQWTGAGAADTEDIPVSLSQATKLAAVDLFIENTQPGKRYPNIAHYLLLGGMGPDHHIQDPHALDGRATSIHVIFDMLTAGIPKVKGHHKERRRQQARHMNPLFIAQPGLAERLYHVVYELCSHTQTSDFTMRYLRTREDFFARQLAAVTFKVPTLEDDPFVEVVYTDGTRVTTTAPVLCSFLRLRSWIIDMAALELHVLTNKGHRRAASDLLEIVFGNDEAIFEGVDAEGLNTTVMGRFNDVGQSHSRIIEFLHSLDFDWSDSVAPEPIELQFLSQLNLLSCIRTDDSGCEVVDEAAVLSLLSDARRALNAQGKIITPTHVQQLAAETHYVLESCVVENHRRKVHYAVSAGYEAWRRLLDMTLMKCFTQLPHDNRENLLFDLLHALPMAIRSPNVEESTAVLLSEAILSCITKLREDRRHQIIVQSAGGDTEAGTLPLERLTALLRNILDIIMDTNSNEFIRGNLYAALINYQHLVTSKDSGSESDMRSLSASMLTSSITDVSLSSSQLPVVSQAASQKSRHGTATLSSVSLAVLKGTADRLTTVVARDAIDGNEVWKSIAFMLLDALVHMFRPEAHNNILTSLVRHGVLANVVRGIKETDLLLQSVLEPEPDDLNPLYIYEAKMSMLIQIAQTRQGAERLLEVQLLRVLGQCDFLDARPELNQAFIDQDDFLPSAIERYHQLFMPALQAVEAILVTLGSQHVGAAKQALAFLSSHRDTIVILLKNESSSTITLSIVEEIHLLVSLCVSVLPLVPKSEMLSSNAGFGGIHAAILSLSARGLAAERWLHNVLPQTEVERRDATVYLPGQKSETKFSQSVRQRERMLRESLVAYLGAASNFTEPEFNLVLSPVTTSSFKGDGAAHYQALIPTVGDAIEALNDICEDLSNTLTQISDIAAELANREHLQVDHMQEILEISDADFLDELDIGQKRTLVCRVLEDMASDARRVAGTLLTTIEMLSLLLWRHLLHYGEGRDTASLQMKASLSQSMRFITAPDANSFRGEVGGRLAPVLQQLVSIDLESPVAPKEWRSNKAYLDTLVRKLREVADLGEQNGYADGL
ncbi:hypothetical protein GLOTRDRAFT_115998 [Gloeophyllum trabeum ATCC 11539]|uniref:Nucleoporin n=1 Tax=Gloeophyllum trabeum (strain ATCC 11539 / FP-39264 / Madison 617) TaxID=670483 RepID=S7Q6U9_GLOTA|nr:uncharacterized protein GLOTRDRAFT_115998 [Gloeophyllum trabeum ATCC 11539]EPQ55766.1 hypothetical protein GLOTRDRAFT_115998 [Gloeophyllum trabeum ATCC 11539]